MSEPIELGQQEKKIEEKRNIYSGVTVPVKLLDKVILIGFGILVVFLIILFLL